MNKWLVEYILVAILAVICGFMAAGFVDVFLR